MYRYTIKMLWDLPAILSTIYLNYKLVKELEHEKEEKARIYRFSYKEEELAINSEVNSVFNASELEESDEFYSSDI
jgi:hypothetical protein